MGAKGIFIRQTGDRIIFRESLKDSSGMSIATGLSYLRIFELQTDGSLKSYDFNDNTFKTGALTTATASMTHRTGNNSTYNTGIWTYALTTVSGFTTGNLYIYSVSNVSATPPVIEREFQYGGAEGDVTNTAISNFSSAYTAFETGTAQAGGASTITLRSGSSSTNDIFKDQAIFIMSGTGACQTNRITAYNGTTKVATVGTAWATQPDNTSVYIVLGRIG